MTTIQSTLYLGNSVKITGPDADFSQAVLTISDATSMTSPITLRQAQAVEDMLNLSMASQSSRIDALFEGTTPELDTLSKIVNYTQTLTSQTAATAATSIASETTRAVAAEKIQRFNSVVLPVALSIYADGDKPSLLLTDDYVGWYYENIAGKKINWYIPPTRTATLVADMKTFSIAFKALSMKSLPYITIYTKTKTSGNAASWYCSRKTWEARLDPSAVLGNYTLNVLFDASACAPNIAGHTNITAQFVSLTSNGSFAATEEILCYSISTNSINATADSKFILSQAITTEKMGTTQFMPDTVKLRIDMTAASSTTALANEITARAASDAALLSKIDQLYTYFFKHDSSTPI